MPTVALLAVLFQGETSIRGKRGRGLGNLGAKSKWRANDLMKCATKPFNRL